jgi:hypothetical protein
MACKKHRVIVIPGLGDGVRGMRWATQHWKKHGLEPVILPVGWYDSESFASKLERLVEYVDEWTGNATISVVGSSAGASAALNLFMEWSECIHRVVSVCGRLRKGTEIGLNSFGRRSKRSVAFAESVAMCEERQSFLSSDDHQRIMTIRAWPFDGIVPGDTSTLPGAKNIRVPVPIHAISIAAALWLFHKPIIQFLTETNN